MSHIRERIINEHGHLVSAQAYSENKERLHKLSRKHVLVENSSKILENSLFTEKEKEGALGSLYITKEELKMPELKSVRDFLKRVADAYEKLMAQKNTGDSAPKLKEAEKKEDKILEPKSNEESEKGEELIDEL